VVRLSFAIAPAVVAALALPAAAEAASLSVNPVKSCYRSGERVGLSGTGFTPSGTVSITSDGKAIGSRDVDPAGAFSGELIVSQPSGERGKTYAARDSVNPAIAAAAAIRASAVSVDVRPRSAPPGRRVTISARGFTTGARLYAHVIRGRYRRNVRVGALRGACHRLTTRARIFSSGTPNGTYMVQFDARRRYSGRTAVRARFSVIVFRTFRESSTAGR
jgi:hypothetical protein